MFDIDSGIKPLSRSARMNLHANNLGKFVRSGVSASPSTKPKAPRKFIATKIRIGARGEGVAEMSAPMPIHDRLIGREAKIIANYVPTPKRDPDAVTAVRLKAVSVPENLKAERDRLNAEFA